MENLLDNFYGNKALHKMLTNSVICEHLCHAYLFYGEKGIGKHTLATRFAATILCQGETDNRPCYSCRSCKKLISGSHPDVFFYGNNNESGGKNSLHIEEIREFRQDAFIMPNESKYKIYIIENAQDMTIAAANAFLKILEEPPKHAMFILTADSKTSVFETILSRCLPLELFPISLDEEKQAIEKLFPDISSELKHQAIIFSNGVLGKAIGFLNNDNSMVVFENIKKALNALSSRNEYELLKALHSVNSSKPQMIEFIHGFVSVLRRVCLLKLSADKNDDDPVLKALSQRLTQQAIFDMIEVLETAKRAIEGNVNMGLLENNLSVNLIACL